jgi:hypothetical protein
MPRRWPSRFVVAAVLVVGACTRHSPPTEKQAIAPSAAPPPSAAAPDAEVVVAAAPDAGPPPAPAPPHHGPYKVVLHIGDSTVGYMGGLTKALETRFKAEGTKRWVSEAVTSASVANFDQSKQYRGLIAQYKPDLVIITLGANDVFIPRPDVLASSVKKIAKRASFTDCVWIGPPTWKKDSGIVDVIRDHSGPCRFFDSSLLTLKRRGDGIHPTDEGGETWAALFWPFFKGDPLTSR